MASPALQNLFKLLRRGPVMTSVPPTAGAASSGEDAAALARSVAQLVAEVDRLKAAQLALEAKYDAIAARDPTAATTSTTPAAGNADFRRLEAAIAALQGRVSEVLASHASAAIAGKRVDAAIAGVRADLNGTNVRVGAIDRQAGEDRKRIDASIAGAREVQEAIAASTRQLESARDELGIRAEELGQRLAARLAPLYLLSMVALLAALATLAILFWKL